MVWDLLSHVEERGAKPCLLLALKPKLPGDFGFDPLGLGKDPAFLKWYREAELIHARWLLAAWSGVPWFEAGADPNAIAPFSFEKNTPEGLSSLNEKSIGLTLNTRLTSREIRLYHRMITSLVYFELICFLWGGLRLESKRWVDFFNPDSESVERPKLAEIKHARIAMLIFYFEAGQGKTLLGVLGL
ncbi:unnamed protein product [Lupinus luteus]|uniref:Chlorophyll a-b binding protein, chloroplastic n=1 Tax=Lupinus luteus TaxID=3873 RepID=A0AAV1X1I4_LUPLU